MRLVRYADGSVRYGRIEDDGTIKPLKASPYEGLDVTCCPTHVSKVRLLAPIEPRSVIGVGRNYADHVTERDPNQKAPSIPMLFMKPLSSVIGPDEPIVYPTGSTIVQYEGELAAVIGKTARHVSEQDALGYVLGYTCANDVSERTIQREEMVQGALFVGKGFDTFCPLGPALLVGGDPTNMQLTTRLNGQVKQSISTKQMLFPVATLIAWMSKAFTLFPGDVIITGTPKGVGNIKPSDVIEVEISGIGTLRNPVIAESR